jgi:hypothetical protein
MKRLALTLALPLLAITGCGPQYEATAGRESTGIYILNTQTGEVRFCAMIPQAQAPYVHCWEQAKGGR